MLFHIIRYFTHTRSGKPKVFALKCFPDKDRIFQYKTKVGIKCVDCFGSWHTDEEFDNHNCNDYRSLQ